ncbi:MAG: hypothetical protein FJ087_19035 [Deltaproteobacteria bacterium]|nr:hypothetical protein [Deltaproteobacteria bacterium]
MHGAWQVSWLYPAAFAGVLVAAIAAARAGGLSLRGLARVPGAVFRSDGLLVPRLHGAVPAGGRGPAVFVAACAAVVAGATFVLFLKELVEFGPHASLFQFTGGYIEDISYRHPHIEVPPVDVRVLDFLLWGTMDTLEALVRLAVRPVPEAAFAHRTLMLLLNVSSCFVLYRVARRRLDGAWAAAFLAVTPLFVPYFTTKAAAGQFSVNLFFLALAQDALDRARHTRFAVFLALFGLVNPVNVVNGLIWVALLYRAADAERRRALRRALVTQSALAAAIAAIGAWLYFGLPSERFGGTPGAVLGILSDATWSRLPEILATYAFGAAEVAVAFSVFLFLPLNRRLLLVVLPDLFLFVSSSWVLHGCVTSFVGFLCLAAIDGVAVATARAPEGGRRARLQARLALGILALAVAYSAGARWQGVNVPSAVVRTVATAAAEGAHPRTLRSCLAKVPPGSYCIASRSLVPYMDGVRRSVGFDDLALLAGRDALPSFCRSAGCAERANAGLAGHETCRRAFEEQPDCILLDLDTYEKGDRLFVDDLLPQLGRWLEVRARGTPVQGFDRALLDRLAMVLGDFTACGLDRGVVESLASPDRFECADDNVVLAILGR